MTTPEIEQLLKNKVADGYIHEIQIAGIAKELENIINLVKHQEQVRLTAVFKIFLEDMQLKFTNDGNMELARAIQHMADRVKLILAALKPNIIEAETVGPIDQSN